MRTRIAEATRKLHDFKSRLKLKTAEQPEWPIKQTSLQELFVYGGIFALIEFVVSWYFLKDQLGNYDAIKVAGLAVIVIGLLAFGCAAIFQFMRRDQAVIIRILAGIGYAFLLFMVFCGFGLLLDYRDDIAGELNVDFILKGYRSMLRELDNLALFLINFFALAFFYWKSLLFFDRFHGYGNVEKPFSAAQQEWDMMFKENGNNIEAALNHASDKADKDKYDADEAFTTVQNKISALENIQSIIRSAYVNYLERAHRDSIQKYRDSNTLYRNSKVNPRPEYFDRDPEIRAVEEYLAKDYEVEKFIASHNKTIDQAADIHQKIKQTRLTWQSERLHLHDRWAQEFKQKINNAGQ